MATIIKVKTTVGDRYFILEKEPDSKQIKTFNQKLGQIKNENEINDLVKQFFGTYETAKCIEGEAERFDNYYVFVGLTRIRYESPCNETWHDDFVIPCTKEEFQKLKTGFLGIDQDVKEFIFSKLAGKLGNKNGWEHIVRDTCTDYNWGDFINDNMCGFCLPSNEFRSTENTIVCNLFVNQDELIAPTVDVTWTAETLSGEYVEKAAKLDMKNGYINLSEEDDMEQYRHAKIIFSNGDTLMCDPDELFLKLSPLRDLRYVHATFGAYKDKIQKQGLIPSKNQNWDCEPGVYLIADKDLENAKETAISMCEAAEYVPDEIYNSGIVTFEVLEVPKNLEIDKNIILDKDQKPYSFVTKEQISAFVLEEI